MHSIKHVMNNLYLFETIFRNIDTIYDHLSIIDISNLRQSGFKDINKCLEKFPKKRNIDKVFKMSGKPYQEPSEHHKLHFKIEHYETPIANTVQEYINVYRTYIETMCVNQVLPALKLMIRLWMLDIKIITTQFNIENIEECLQKLYDSDKEKKPHDVSEIMYNNFFNLIVSFRLFSTYFSIHKTVINKDMIITISDLTNNICVLGKNLDRAKIRNTSLSLIKFHQKDLDDAIKNRSIVYTEKVEPFRQVDFVLKVINFIKNEKDNFISSGI